MKTGVLTSAVLALGAGFVMALAGCTRDADGEAPVAAVEDAIENQRFCPVMEGMPIDENIYADHDGKRVYFCCAGCPAAFEADPEKYMETLKEIHADPDQEPAAQDHDHHHHDH